MRTRSQQQQQQRRRRPLDGEPENKKKQKKKITGKKRKESSSQKLKRLAAVRERYRAAALEGSYGGRDALARTLDSAAGNTRRAKRISAEEALRAEESYTLHRPVRYKFPRRRIIVGGPHHQWQADLVDVSSFSSENSGSKYLLCVIDVFSKFAWVKAIRSKRGEEVSRAFEDILNQAGTAPMALQTDKGGEFRARTFQEALKSRNIHYFSTENDDIKASVVERFQLTLQRKMYRYFSATRSSNYGDILRDLLKSYNSSYHRSIGMSPTEALEPGNVETVWQRLYEHEPMDATRLKARTKAPGLKKGDFVRISKTRKTFQRGYLPYWTREIFKINRVIVGTSPVTYTLEDYGGELLNGSFYEKELQKVDPPDYYDIEEILDTRKRRGAMEYLVKWRGYPSSFNSWEKDIVMLSGDER